MHTDLIPNSSILYKVGTDGKKHESGRRLVRVDSIQASVFSSFNRFDHGPLYKGWGQFAWNGNEKGEPIKIDEIYRSNTKQESYTTVSAMDLNGDSYPDWIRENNGKIRVPLTHQIGTLGDGQDYGVEPSMSYGESENIGGEPDSAWIPIAISFPISKNNLEKQQPLSLRVWQACNKPSDWIRMPKGRALAATSRKELAVPAVISQAEHQSPYVPRETLTETDCPI